MATKAGVREAKPAVEPAMTRDSTLADLQVLQPGNRNDETNKRFDRVNIISLTLAAATGITLLAIVMASIWK